MGRQLMDLVESVPMLDAEAFEEMLNANLKVGYMEGLLVCKPISSVYRNRGIMVDMKLVNCRSTCTMKGLNKLQKSPGSVFKQ